MLLLLTAKGPRDSETIDWVAASGLSNFDTFYARCKHALLDEDFEWPPDVPYVDIGFGEKITRPKDNMSVFWQRGDRVED